mmetsp:Transcript_12295/g.29569  ORF Transcript_12295/g.29569 Transcript_12295/m.29569 type:complete len:315 (+) Transcript_12295:111-1055(+)
MPRYSDQWLIDRTMFDYVQGGSCACCVGSFLFMPGGTAGIIETMSEFDTDSKRDEIAALHQLPWPVEMKDEVWMERVRLRQYCKRTMKRYKEFWDKSSQPTQIILSPEPTTAPESESSTTSSLPLSQSVPQITFEEWFMSLERSQLAKYFQLPRTEPLERIQQEHHHQQPHGQKPFLLHPAFGTVLCAVTEQVAHFNLTCYPSDGRGEAELGFEDILAFHKRGGFTLIDDSVETRRKWLLRHQTLGGPKLLENQNDDNSDEEEGDDNATGTGTGTDAPPLSIPSFRSDRRIMRLLIARCFADALQSAYLKDIKE